MQVIIRSRSSKRWLGQCGASNDFGFPLRSNAPVISHLRHLVLSCSSIHDVSIRINVNQPAKQDAREVLIFRQQHQRHHGRSLLGTSFHLFPETFDLLPTSPLTDSNLPVFLHQPNLITMEGSDHALQCSGPVQRLAGGY